MRVTLMALVAATSVLAGHQPTLAQATSAERPRHAVGHVWRLDTGVFEMKRLDDATYVFGAADGREIHLVDGLVPVRYVRDGRLQWELLPAPRLKWPLRVGDWGTSEIQVHGPAMGASGIYEGSLVWRVEAIQEVAVSGRATPALRVAFDWESPWAKNMQTTRRGSVTVWYAPSRSEVIRIRGDSGAPTVEVVDAEPAPAAPPAVKTTGEPAQRPTLLPAVVWPRDDGRYTLTVRDADMYTFVDDTGRRVWMTAGLALAGAGGPRHVDWSFDPPAPIRWPLTLGDSGTITTVLRNRALTAEGAERVRLTWLVEATEEVETRAGRFDTFRVVQSWQPIEAERVGDTSRSRGSLVAWYAPELSMLVRARSGDLAPASFDLVARPASAPAPGSLVVAFESGSVEVWHAGAKVAEASTGGEIRLGEVPAGVYRIRVRPSGAPEWEREVRVQSNLETRVAPDTE